MPVDNSAVDAHRASGRRFTAAGVPSFVLDEGQGAPVVCLHGVPTSSFLYRKVVRELAQENLRGVAFDLPGLGLAGRPEDFDYSWSGLARWTASAIDALDTVIDVGAFRQPWPMRPFAQPGLGELWLAGMIGPVWRWLFRREGVADRSSVSGAEIDAYLSLLKQEDGGRAFLKMMRSFELTQAKQDFYYRGLAARPPYPAQVVWGEGDRMLGADRRLAVQDALGATACSFVPGRHFIPEDHAPAVAAAIAKLAQRP